MWIDVSSEFDLKKTVLLIEFVIQVWKAKSLKARDGYDWTSLRGHDRRVLLQKLPPSIPSLLPEGTGERVKTLWERFNGILSTIDKWSPTEADFMDLEVRVRQWLELFLGLSSMEGHQKKNITPYIHIMLKHIPDQMRQFGGIKRFSGQELEKNNDDARRNYLSSNHLDAPWDILLTEARLTALSSCQRQKRSLQEDG